MSTKETHDTAEDGEDVYNLEFLIEAVRKNPVLFTPRHAEYKLQGKKELVWMQISEDINQPVKWCKGKWKYLRDNYRQKKRSLKGKSGDAAKRIKQWIYFNLLSFLDSSIEDAETSGNLFDDENSLEDDIFLNSPSTPTPDYSAEVACKTPNKKRKSDRNDAVDAALINYLSTKANENEEKKDSHYHFGMDVAEHLRRLPPDAATYVKMKVHQALFEVEQKLKSCTRQESKE